MTRKIKRTRSRKPRGRVSLTELAVKQIELMLAAELKIKRRPIPNAKALRAMAKEYHERHFGDGRFDE